MPDSVARFADAIGAPLYHWGTDFGPQQAEGESWNWYGSDFDGQPLQFHHLPQPTLPFANAATALQAMILAGITPVEEAVREAIPRAQLTGRMQRVDYRGRELLLDVAHNPHAAAYLAERLPFSAGKTWAVVGMLADKDLQGTLHALQRRVDHWYLANLDCPRGASAQQLAVALGLPGLSGYDSVASALTAAVAASQPGDRLLVVGSFYTVADALSVIQE